MLYGMLHCSAEVDRPYTVWTPNHPHGRVIPPPFALQIKAAGLNHSPANSSSSKSCDTVSALTKPKDTWKSKPSQFHRKVLSRAAACTNTRAGARRGGLTKPQDFHEDVPAEERYLRRAKRCRLRSTVEPPPANLSREMQDWRVVTAQRAPNHGFGVGEVCPEVRALLLRVATRCRAAEAEVILPGAHNEVRTWHAARSDGHGDEGAYFPARRRDPPRRPSSGSAGRRP